MPSHFLLAEIPPQPRTKQPLSSRTCYQAGNIITVKPPSSCEAHIKQQSFSEAKGWFQISVFSWYFSYLVTDADTRGNVHPSDIESFDNGIYKPERQWDVHFRSERCQPCRKKEHTERRDI